MENIGSNTESAVKKFQKTNQLTADGIVGPNKPWCAMFVSWCANKAGIDTSVIPKHASCDKGVTWFKNKSKFKTRVSGYTPKAGDIIYFGSASDATHVGIVEKVSNKRVHTIEGNTSDCVARRDYSLTSTDIYGYGIPNYASK